MFNRVFNAILLQNFSRGAEARHALDCTSIEFDGSCESVDQGLRQDLETGCLKLAIVKFLGVQILKGDHNILRFHPYENKA